MRGEKGLIGIVALRLHVGSFWEAGYDATTWHDHSQIEAG